MSFFRDYVGPTPKTTYQTSFVDPRRYTITTFNTNEKGPFHQLKGTHHDIAKASAKYVVIPKVSTQPKIQRKPLAQKSYITVRKFACTPEPQVWSAGDYTTVYSRDYRDWRQEVPERFKLKPVYEHFLYSSQQNRTFARREKQVPIESTTIYSADYVHHHRHLNKRVLPPVGKTLAAGDSV